jgi:hypothetical protein
MVTWSQILLQSAKERLLINRMSSERLVMELPPAPKIRALIISLTLRPAAVWQASGSRQAQPAWPW